MNNGYCHLVPRLAALGTDNLAFTSCLGRPLPKNFDNLNREELLYELEMALQDNEGLIQQLASECPPV